MNRGFDVLINEGRIYNIPGTIFKLESPQGIILGAVMIPQDWVDMLRVHGDVAFCIAPPVSIKSYYECTADDQIMLRHARLMRSCGNHPDALTLCGASLEEFERMPGCAFMPGAAYLRSVVD